MGIPMYFDTIGTIFVAFLGGSLPAIITGLLTNLVLNIFVQGYLYFSIINVIIAVLASWFFHYFKSSKALQAIYFILSSAVICSVIGMGIQSLITGLPMEAGVEEVSQLIYKGDGGMYVLTLMFVSFFLNIVDKGVSLIIAYLGYTLVPEKLRIDISNYGWKQKPLTVEEVRAARNLNTSRRISQNVSFILSTTIILLSIILIWISITFYYDDCKDEYTDEAFAIVESAASFINGDDINEYVRWGKKATGYLNLEKQLKMLLNNTQGVVKLSVFIPEQNGYLYIFQEAKPGVPILENGKLLPYEEHLYPYADRFRRKEVVDEIMFSSDKRIMSASYPIRNSDGDIISYVIADVYMSFLSEYARDYLIKTFLCFSGFIVMILIFGFNQAGYDLVVPINSITKAASDFLDSHGDQKALDENVRKTRAIGIRTGDEVEQLYSTICKMESEMAEYVRDLRHFADNNKKTQNGLIITLAGIVESRDSDSNSHVRNTAAYVRIILNGLRRKGYYAEKISDEYMEEVEMSAPLHDIGKIHIPDAILNKRGELTKEEEEIYRSHTVYGRQIMDKAISTIKEDSYLKEARNMAAYHHERWDGKGFPDGLHGEVIPLSARIMALANELDDLTAPRKFKMTYTLDEAIEIIKDESGKSFDPKCVEALLECINEVKMINKNNSFSRF
jgi:response regulator RpfG family c-di-GMP phosphodiesterase